MLCSKCKKEIPDVSVYCMFCGKKLISTPRRLKTHAPNGTGTVYKRGNTWTIKVRTIRNGKAISHTKGGFATKAEAMNYAPMLRAAEQGGEVRRTVNQLFQMVQTSRKWQDISPDKRSHYLTAYKKLESIHDRNAASLRYSELQNLIDGIEGAFYPKRDCKTVLQKIYDMGVLEEVVPPAKADMVSRIELPTKPLTSKDARTPEEMRAIWHDWQTTQRPAAGYALIMAYTGMRTGELFAQDVAKIDLGAHRIVGGIKTAAGKDREIPIAEAIIPVLQALIPQARNGLVAYGEDAYYSEWKSMIQRTGIRPLGSYCQRHTCYTRLHELVPAVSDVLINSIVGHTNTKAALGDTYAHISLAAKLDAVNRMRMV